MPEIEIAPGVRVSQGDAEYKSKIAEFVAARFDIEQAIEAASVPQAVTPRQIRLALIASGIALASIEAALAGNEAAKVEWDFALEIRRDHALLNAFAGSLGLTSGQVDNLFRLADTL